MVTFISFLTKWEHSGGNHDDGRNQGTKSIESHKKIESGFTNLQWIANSLVYWL